MTKEEIDAYLADWTPNCKCTEGQLFCGDCVECGKPGHIQHFPAPLPYTLPYCDDCAKLIKRLYLEGRAPRKAYAAFLEIRKKEKEEQKKAGGQTA